MIVTNALLAVIVFLLLSDRFGSLAAAVGVFLGFLGYVIVLLTMPVVGWWFDCAGAFVRRYSDRNKSDMRDAP